MSQDVDKKPTLVVVSEVKWRHLRTRKQYLLSAWPEGWEIIFLEPIAFGQANSFTWRRDGRVRYATVPFLKAGTTSGPYERLTATGLGRAVLSALAGIWTRILLRFCDTGFPRRRFLLVSNVLAWPSVSWLARRLAVYDMNDDVIGFHPDLAWVADAARRTLHDTDLTVACSRGLAARGREDGAAEVMVIGNGVDAAALVPPADARDAPGHPCLGYMGALGPWIDFPLLHRLVADPAIGSLLIVGPVQPVVQAEMDALAAANPKVQVIGRVPHEEVQGWLRAFDVALIPFLRSRQTDVLNPNKLYEYYAAGVTVVTFDLSEELRDERDRLYLARDHESFVAAVHRALAAPIDPEALRRFAAANTWQARATRYAEELLARPGARHSSTTGDAR